MADTACSKAKTEPRPSQPVPVGQPAVFTRRGPAWSEVTMLAEGRARLRFGGLFRTAWMGALCQGLSERHLSIEHAHARITHDGSWNVELSVTALPGAPDPASLPLIALTELEVVAEAPTLRLDRYALHESPDHGGSLLVALEAQDSLGLLGQLLLSLAALSLFPIEMHIETREGRAFDSLWLGTATRQTPSKAMAQALSQLLTSCTSGPAAARGIAAGA